MKCILAGTFLTTTLISAIWILLCCDSSIVPEIKGGVYKTLQTKGPGGRRLTSFFTRLTSDKPVYSVVELDLNRGESITITCPASRGGGTTLFPSRLTAYYRSPPSNYGSLNIRHYSENDLINELLTEGDERLGLLEHVSDSLILIPYGANSRRLSFLWKGTELKQRSTLYFMCLKEYLTQTTFEPSALIVVRVIPDHPAIKEHVLDMTHAEYLPRHHDMIYTKEYSPADALTVQCGSKDGSSTQEAWKLLDIDKLPHNLLSKVTEDGIVLNENWRENVLLTNMEVDLEHLKAGTIKIVSNDLSSMLYMFEWAFYISCANETKASNRIFRIIPNTVSTLDLLKPNVKQIHDGEAATLQEDVSHFEYKVNEGKAVALLCPIKTHTLEPQVLIANIDETFRKEVHLNLPNTMISKRGASLLVIDFSNTSALNNVRFQIRCSSKDQNFTSYVFALTNRMACIFDDNVNLWRPCKVVLFPSEELTVRCPRRSENTHYGLAPEDIRDGYVKVDDDFVKDRHPAISRTVIQKPTGDLHKITFTGHANRGLIRDEIHYECADRDRENYTTIENWPIVIIKLVGKFEKVSRLGNLVISPSDLLTLSDPPRLFHVLLSAGTTRTIKCSDFFVEPVNTNMYPQGKWDVFDDIPRLFSGLILSKIPGRKVYSTRAIHGLGITKHPTVHPTSVELSLKDDYELTSRSDEVLYFVCSRNDVWNDERTGVAVVQVYIPTNTTDLYGVSVEKGLFRLDDDCKNSTYDNARFNILDHSIIAMHCPKGPEDINLPQCFDLRLEGDDDVQEDYDNNVPGIMDKREPGLIKSLWFITTEKLRQSYENEDVNVGCYCLNENGTVLANVRLTSVPNYANAQVKIGIIAILMAVTSIELNIY